MWVVITVGSHIDSLLEEWQENGFTKVLAVSYAYENSLRNHYDEHNL